MLILQRIRDYQMFSKYSIFVDFSKVFRILECGVGLSNIRYSYYVHVLSQYLPSFDIGHLCDFLLWNSTITFRNLHIPCFELWQFHQFTLSGVNNPWTHGTWKPSNLWIRYSLHMCTYVPTYFILFFITRLKPICNVMTWCRFVVLCKLHFKYG